MASATTAPTATTATITSAIGATISAAAEILAAAIAATRGAWCVILRRVVVGREILRRGGVGLRLALIGGVVRIVVAFVVNFGDVSVGDFAFGNGLLDDAGLRVVRERIVRRGFFVE